MAELRVALLEAGGNFVCVNSLPDSGSCHSLIVPCCSLLTSVSQKPDPAGAPTLPLAGIHMSFSTVMTQQQLKHFHADLYIRELTFQF